MNKKNCLLAGMLSLSTFAHAEFTKPVLGLDMGAFNVKEDALLSRGASTQLEAKFNYLDEDFKLNFNPVVSFITGQQTSRDPQSPLTNSFYLKEANFEKEFHPIISMKIGSLYQKEFLPGMAGYTKSFPGLGLKLKYDYSGFMFNANIEAAVPTSSGLATTSSELESNSTLYAGTLSIKKEWTDKLNTIISYSHFKFNKLSTQAGYDSLQRGNTVIKTNSTTGYFVYKYDGDEVLLNLNYLMMELIDWKISMGGIKNQSAPDSLSSGYFVKLAPGVRISSKYVLRPQAGMYRTQRDAMVAVFSDTNYGRTNRKGFNAGFALESTKYDFSLVVSKSKLVVTNPFQSDDHSAFLNLSIKNISL